MEPRGGLANFLRMLGTLLFLLAIGAWWAPDPYRGPWHGRLIAAGLFCWSFSTFF
jgi:hypothetical protein